MDDKALQRRVAALRPDQQDRLEVVLNALEAVPEIDLLPTGDLISNDWATRFADVLKLHHVTSGEAFTKDKFEYAFVAVSQQLGIGAVKAPRGNPGWDVTVQGCRISLKTQADTDLKLEQVHISKFMELGRGVWQQEADLVGLRQRMFDHMDGYDRIFSLRALAVRQEWFGDLRYQYELVEIPKALLLLSANFVPIMKASSRQTPKPGICSVFDDARRLIFELYFDGGTERKLQVRKLRKSACTVHATWTFTMPPEPLV